MDVDEICNDSSRSSPEPRGAQDDIDQTLLQSFSCLGTTDHEELISQLQQIIGQQISYTTAKFFLDMNNWNLHAAVGCYFDYYTGLKTFSMKVLVNVTDLIKIRPNTNYVQTWLVLNDGDETWPEGCYLHLVSPAEKTRVPVKRLKPGESTRIDVWLMSPVQLGVHQNKWRMSTPCGMFYGDTLWAMLEVDENAPDVRAEDAAAQTKEIEERLQNLWSNETRPTTESRMELVPHQSNYGQWPNIPATQAIALPPPPPGPSEDTEM
ncbi:protein ILRUN [Lutzomyia longipalpis]|uniref:Nbr1 FW domain-containing protein n=1 Tax=Lutzomyia longipalpis TaxID=7200 RepID=A0A1B0GKB8_LUTLO|nr:protein ILRUN [Lutzomyia longipalpis]